MNLIKLNPVLDKLDKILPSIDKTFKDAFNNTSRTSVLGKLEQHTKSISTELKATNGELKTLNKTMERIAEALENNNK